MTPHRPDAWIDIDKIKLGCEVSFNKHFFRPKNCAPLKTLLVIFSWLRKLLTAFAQILGGRFKDSITSVSKASQSTRSTNLQGWIGWVRFLILGRSSPCATSFSERRETVSALDFTPLSVSKAGVTMQLESAVKSADPSNRKLVRKGDFAINSRSDRKGSSGTSELIGSVSQL